MRLELTTYCLEGSRLPTGYSVARGDSFMGFVGAFNGSALAVSIEHLAAIPPGNSHSVCFTTSMSEPIVCPCVAELVSKQSW